MDHLLANNNNARSPLSACQWQSMLFGGSEVASEKPYTQASGQPRPAAMCCAAACLPCVSVSSACSNDFSSSSFTHERTHLRNPLSSARRCARQGKHILARISRRKCLPVLGECVRAKRTGMPSSTAAVKLCANPYKRGHIGGHMASWSWCDCVLEAFTSGEGNCLASAQYERPLTTTLRYFITLRSRRRRTLLHLRLRAGRPNGSQHARLPCSRVWGPAAQPVFSVSVGGVGTRGKKSHDERASSSMLPAKQNNLKLLCCAEDCC